ncbi:hypothetical protein NIES4072_21500 [Nostoc commune NIES-4072]|uniref:Nucleic acid-binding protein n=1 Tax=Nostoc commune NIES-4072 TaxID=2005467 RepID=A0A2R5FJL7_NOSCO|nr:DUF3368 domain-containing protein [Nostoc commune]BBD64188.1 hypothetical protein NIES4070_05300 [Nostoc commune HK-02]GBG18485.1 hypothetical protein NIES4072_21500 [Nostoc commune NIES-4072]
MTIVSNTSPISNLAKVGQINLLQQLYETVLIPTAVYDELLDERAGEDVITAVQSAIWLKIQVVQNQELVSELRNLINLGEAEAIALAIEVNAVRLLIDERLGRQAATDRRLRITGVFGVLLTAKRQGLITAIKPVMDDLVAKANFRVSSQLYAEVLMAANE